MLKILKKLPVTNKTILTESKVLDIVTKWSESEVSEISDIVEATSEAADNTEDDSEVLLSPPVVSNKNPVSILASLRDSRAAKKRVKFADEASSSDSESRTSESDFPLDSVEGDVSSTSQSKKPKRKLQELRRKVLNKDASEPDVESSDGSQVSQSVDSENDPSSAEQIGTSQTDVDTDNTALDSSEATATDKTEPQSISEEDKAELEHVIKLTEVKAMARDLLNAWSGLKVC